MNDKILAEINSLRKIADFHKLPQEVIDTEKIPFYTYNLGPGRKAIGSNYEIVFCRQALRKALEGAHDPDDLYTGFISLKNIKHKGAGQPGSYFNVYETKVNFPLLVTRIAYEKIPEIPPDHVRVVLWRKYNAGG